MTRLSLTGKLLGAAFLGVACLMTMAGTALSGGQPPAPKKIQIKIIVDGKEIDHLPAGEGAQARVEPIYETIEGWKEPTANARSWADLPAQAIKYVRRVEELVGCPIALLSTSPEREDTILVQNPFEA